MSTTITISLSDADYERLREAAAHASHSPEELAAAAIAEKYSEHETIQSADGEARINRDPLIAIMRARGHLANPRAYPSPDMDDLPPPGSAAYKQLLEEIGQELSDAVEQSGKSLADLVERR